VAKPVKQLRVARCAITKEDAMRARCLLTLAAMMALSQLFLPARSRAHEPGSPEPAPLKLNDPSATPNQRLADVLAEQLRQCSELRHYRIDLRVTAGLIEVQGEVADIPQRDLVLRVIQGIPGVTQVRDLLTVRSGAGIARVNGGANGPALQEPAPLLRKGDAPVGPGTLPPEPTPIFQAPPPGMANGPQGNYGQPPPPLPPYAWPTYAPYNNYSRVAYPTLYPYQSWPFIGPMYPFPKVPLGWRSISLEYYDGHWWYGRHSKGHDWWRVRYW
jgi:hypothetical protein